MCRVVTDVPVKWKPLIKRFTINRLFIVIIGPGELGQVSKKSGVKEDDDDDDEVQVLNYPRGVSGSGVVATILD